MGSNTGGNKGSNTGGALGIIGIGLGRGMMGIVLGAGLGDGAGWYQVTSGGSGFLFLQAPYLA